MGGQRHMVLHSDLTLSVALGRVGITVDRDGRAVGPRATFTVAGDADVAEVRSGQRSVIVEVGFEQEVVALLRQIAISRAHCGELFLTPLQLLLLTC